MKIQVRERFSALTIFHFSETFARRFIRSSSIGPRNTFRHREDQRTTEERFRTDSRRSREQKKGKRKKRKKNRKRAKRRDLANLRNASTHV